MNTMVFSIQVEREQVLRTVALASSSSVPLLAGKQCGMRIKSNPCKGAVSQNQSVWSDTLPVIIPAGSTIQSSWLWPIDQASKRRKRLRGLVARSFALTALAANTWDLDR